MQHTATHPESSEEETAQDIGIKLHHTTPRCTTVHNAATHCNTLQHTATHLEGSEEEAAGGISISKGYCAHVVTPKHHQYYM